MGSPALIVTLSWLVFSLLFAVGFAGLYAALSLLPEQRPRWRHAGLGAEEADYRVADWWLRLLLLRRDQPSYLQRAAVLAQCGVRADPALYCLLRRLLLLGGWLAVAVQLLPISGGARAAELLQLMLPNGLSYALPAALLAAAFWDMPMLEAYRKQRAYRMIGDIYRISSQLLYFEGSALHLHTKLTRCVPFASLIRGPLQTMLGEWFHDPAGAVRRFKERLGTAEAASFADTIDAMRLHEHEAFYTLLRERIADHKEKLEFARESRKESLSYVLFVLAGIPIVYTFQVFIYPWVQEGNKLFQSLGG